jgi:hypothetical protein
MNIERTIDTNAVVTPNCAIANRSQTSSYRMLQKPETKKKRKNHTIQPSGTWFVEQLTVTQLEKVAP